MASIFVFFFFVFFPCSYILMKDVLQLNAQEKQVKDADALIERAGKEMKDLKA